MTTPGEAALAVEHAHEVAALKERIAKLEAALRQAIKIANEAHREWDEAPSSMRAGKLLIALSGGCAGYRADIDMIHKTLTP